MPNAFSPEVGDPGGDLTSSVIDYINWKYKQYLPRMFDDWEVVCRVLDADWWGKYHLDPYSEGFPESLYSSEAAVESRKTEISNRDFILFAIEKGYPDVIKHATEALKSDKTIHAAVARANLKEAFKKEKSR